MYIMTTGVALKLQNVANSDGTAFTNYVVLPVTSDHLSEAAALTRGRSRQVSLYIIAFSNYVIGGRFRETADCRISMLSDR